MPPPVVGTERAEASVEATTSGWSEQPPPEPTDTPDGYPASTPTRYAYPHPQAEWTPGPPTLEPTPTLTPTPTPTPSATPPNLLLTDLSAARIATIGTWQSVDNDTAFQLYRISQTPRGVANVSWSPDGQRLVVELLTSEQTMMGYETVPIVIPRGGEGAWSPLILGNTACRDAYEWSPDGSHLVFMRNGEMQVVDANGDPIQTLLPLPDHFALAGPHFLPDGNRVAVIAWSTEDDQTESDLWVYDLRNGALSLLLSDPACGARSSWSLESDALACLSEDYHSTRFPDGAATARLEELDGTTSVAAALTSLPGTEGCLQPPQWVGNGRAVIVTVLHQPGVWLIDREGRVTSLSSVNVGPQPIAFGTGGWGEAAVSPMGQFVLFDPGQGDPMVLDVATDERIPMPPLSVDHARWAPEGPHFLLWGPYYHDYHGDLVGLPLQLVDALTGQVETLDDSGVWPSWSPDGRRITFWKKTEDGKAALWLLELGGEPVRLTSPTPEVLGEYTFFPLGHYDLTPQWSPDGSALAFVSWREEWPEAYVLELE